jgi:hypothetical protein
MTRFSQLMKDVADTSKPLSSILLQARLLARELRSEELNKWVKLELNGYADANDVPDYRIVNPRYFGYFNGPFGSATKNVPLSTSYFPEEFRDLVANFPMPQNIASIEQLLASNTEVYNIPQSGEVVEAFRIYDVQISMQVLNHVNGVFTKPAVAGILHTIRTRLLEFLVQLTEQHPELETDDSAPNKIPATHVAKATQTYILHNSQLNLIQQGENSMGDIYNAGQAGAMGPGAHAHDMTFQQLWTAKGHQIDLAELSSELKRLVPELKTTAMSPEHQIAIGNVEAAAQSAAQNEGPRTLEYLKNAGTWVLGVAEKVGVGLTVSVLKSLFQV